MANENSKPSAKLALKPAGGDKSERVYIAAAWRDENGKMGGLRLDREVEQLAIKMRDGRVIRMTQAPGDNGRPRWSHFLDLFINDEAPRSESRGGGYGGGERPASKPAASGDDFPPGDDFGGDDIPF